MLAIARQDTMERNRHAPHVRASGMHARLRVLAVRNAAPTTTGTCVWSAATTRISRLVTVLVRSTHDTHSISFARSLTHSLTRVACEPSTIGTAISTFSATWILMFFVLIMLFYHIFEEGLVFFRAAQCTYPHCCLEHTRSAANTSERDSDDLVLFVI